MFSKRAIKIVSIIIAFLTVASMIAFLLIPLLRL